MNDENERKIPLLATDLVAKLDEWFPERCPELDWSERTIWHEAGKREVVRFLKELQARQDENVVSEQ